MSESIRIAMGVEYNGSAYNGWQLQAHSPSVQQAIEAALSTVADEPIRVFCAGRTDTGVHALGQVIHFDTHAGRSERSWVFGANANLPKDVTTVWAKPVSGDFHARFSALSRRYRYVILNRDVRPAVLGTRVSWEYRPLDVSRMQAAATHLIGEHDFSSYRALACQAKSPVRTVSTLEVSRKGELIYIDIEANAFLHHMVRNIAGVLMTIGAGEADVDWSREVLEHQDRTRGGVTASPYGLYLTGVTYPSEFAIPEPQDLSQIV